jgi:hypothetical protein
MYIIILSKPSNSTLLPLSLLQDLLRSPLRITLLIPPHNPSHEALLQHVNQLVQPLDTEICMLVRSYLRVDLIDQQYRSRASPEACRHIIYRIPAVASVIVAYLY